MNANQYIEEAIKTECHYIPAFDWRKGVRSMVPLSERDMIERTIGTHCREDLRLDHALCGLVTEAAELLESLQQEEWDTVNQLEELGDVAWYLAIAASSLGLALHYPAEPKELIREVEGRHIFRNAVHEIIILSGKLQNSRKRFLYYGKDFDLQFVRMNVSRIWMICCVAAEAMGSSMEVVCKMNIEKLKARYPDRFSQEKAVDRNLDVERKVLENHQDIKPPSEVEILCPNGCRPEDLPKQTFCPACNNTGWAKPGCMPAKTDVEEVRHVPARITTGNHFRDAMANNRGIHTNS